MLKFFIFISLLSFLNASVLKIDYASKKFEDFPLSYLMDKDANLSIEDIQKMEFKTIKNTHAFSGKTGHTWYKLELVNTTAINKEMFIHNNFAYYSKEIDIFEIHENKLLNKGRYNILAPKEENALLGSTLVYKVIVPADAKKEIFIKNKPMISHLFNVNIYDEKASIDALINSSFHQVMIISILFTLSFYNLTLYFFNKRKEFIFYALYMLTPAIGLAYKYGIVFSHFHLYGENTYWFNLTAIVMNAFLSLFLMETLNTKKLHKKIHMLLKSIILLNILNVFLAFSIDLTFAMELFKIFFVYTFFVMLYLGYYLFQTSHPLAKIFSLAYTFYFTGMLITILAMSGVIEMNSFTFHSGGLGLIIEGLLFSYLMHYNIKILEKEILQQREVIISKNKKAQIGEMISAITHQWKQPLSRVASITALLDFKIEDKQDISRKELSQKISQINADVLFLSTTIDDFKDFFNPNVVSTKCNIEEVIKSAIALSKDDTMAKGIIINTDLHFDFKLQVHKNEFLHILLNLIQNSKEAFKNQSNDINIIKIIGYSKNEKTYIDIVDNAGGINEKTLPFIFNEHYTSKENKSGSGLGLYLTKVILENHLKGSIEAINTPNGVMFRIIL